MTLLATLFPAAASASHYQASLEGSNFEIEDDANLKLDVAAPSLDWGSLAHPNGPEFRATDLPTGQNDNSYKGGVKEDTECPAETTGSIPNNKSDLLTFHVYEEPGSGTHPGFMNLAWSRVSDPSGTTLMDFEFNQSTTACSTGPNVTRTPGDLLIEYAIDQGGARAEITGRRWTGSAWGTAQDLDDGTACGGGPCATGTINQSVIPDADSDGLGEKQARTFGEAQIDLRLIFDSESCVSFGSAMLKSRSSDSFTSQLKDFISPIPINLQNCGNVIIRKQTIPDGETDEFHYTKNFPTDPTTSNTFTLTDDGVQDYNDTVLFGTGYTVVEDLTQLPAGWTLDSIDCSASTGVTVGTDLTTGTVSFDIDSDGDEVDCTYTNKLQQGAIAITKTAKHADTSGETSANLAATFTVTGPNDLSQDVTTDATTGEACIDGLDFGDYTVTETGVPAGYAGADPVNVTIDTNADCTTAGAATAESAAFENTPLTDVSWSVDSLHDGATSTVVTCYDGDGNVLDGYPVTVSDGNGSLPNLLPTDPDVTVTCDFTVDP